MNLNNWINDYYLDEKNILKLNKEFLEAKNFPHISIDNLFKEEKLLELKESLNSEKYYLEESDLYEFLRTFDLKNSRNKNIIEIRKLLLSEEFINLIEKITSTKIKRNYIDLHSLKLKNTHHMLCHDDKVQERKIAFIINLSDMEEKDGGALELIEIYGEDNGNVFKKIIPKLGKFNMFKVTTNSYHSVSENISKKERISISGWYL